MITPSVNIPNQSLFLTVIKYVIILIMFDLGFQELIVIFIVALLVFGPKKLPELAITLGKAVRDLKQSLMGVKEQIDSEIREIKDPIALKNYIYKGDDFLKEIDKVHQKETDRESEDKNKPLNAESTSQIRPNLQSQRTEEDKR